MRKPKVLVAMAVMVAMMVALVGTASATPCGGSCEGTPSGGPGAIALDHANSHAIEALTNVIERRGLR
jgi:hypothetical protein